MTIGPDLKEAITEIGVSIDLYKDNRDGTDTTIEGEHVLYKANSQATKPFIREFFLEAETAYDTQSKAGDVIKFVPTGNKYMLMNSTPVLFEDAVIKNDVVLYKCNVSGEILRLSGESAWNRSTMRKNPQWQQIRANAYALQTEGIYGNSDLPEAPLGAVPEVKHELYIPNSYGIKELDRYQATSGEYYRVEAVFHRRFDSVDVAVLQEDTR